MPLSPGVRIGPYEIQSPLGVGGMGEVYRARDTNLNREVAIKILPEEFARNPERMARFQREAKALAALNHPHIAAIYSLEEYRSTCALALELVEGRTLAERLAETTLRVEDAVLIAKQVAEALEYAHEHGIIHRDLKPANIKVTTDGTVKLLDFGLAKTLERPRGDAAENLETFDTASTFAASVTQTGVIVGTAAYMSPEQARGGVVDRRADIWSFGCVLYEMISGSRPFEGPSVSDVLAAVLRAEPDWQVLPPGTPAAVRDLLRRCLTKDPRRRLRDIGDARLALDEMLTPDDAAAVSLADTHARGKGLLAHVLPWSVAAILLLATVVLVGMMYGRISDDPDSAIVSEILHSAADGRLVEITHPRVSPDGKRLVYLAPGPGGQSLLWVRSLDSLEDASPLKGTEGANNPFWAPDGRHLGFFAGRKLMRIEATGGPATQVSEVTSASGGGLWTPDDFILFARSSTSPIFRISASGGQAVPLTSLDKSRQETGHSAPQLLPDNKHFLYYVVSTSSDLNGIYVGSLDGGEPRLVLRAESRFFAVSSSHLLFVQDGALMARPFDARRLEISGDPVTIAPPRRGQSVLNVTASQSGILFYLSGPTQSAQQLQWFDRNGTPGEIVADRQVFYTPRISPDGREVAVAVVTSPSTRDIWIYDLVQKQPRGPLTFDKLHNWTPVWSPAEYKEGRKLAFSSNPKAQFDIFAKSADGTGVGQALLEDDAAEYIDSWCGNYIAYARGEQKTTPVWDIWVLPLIGDRKHVPFLKTSFNKEEPTFSPDCKWMAYAADERGTGDWDVYVAPFPKGDGKWQVSIGGGRQPRWRADGKELFFLAPGDVLTAAGIQERGGSIEVGARQSLFPTNTSSNFRYYDVKADGSKFLIVMPSGQAGISHLTVIENWQALLQKK